MAPFLCLAQVVPVQANLDAQAQRRIQEQSERVHRQRQIDANLEKIATALSSKNLTSPESPVYTRRALAALFDLQSEGWSPAKSLQEAARLPSTVETPKGTSLAYLTKCWTDFSPSITPTVATTLRAGLSPAFSIPHYVP